MDAIKRDGRAMIVPSGIFLQRSLSLRKFAELRFSFAQNSAEGVDKRSAVARSPVAFHSKTLPFPAHYRRRDRPPVVSAHELQSP
jgi:hypothetical protein